MKYTFQRRIQNVAKHLMELCEKIVNGWKPLIIFAKCSILDVWSGSKHASAFRLCVEYDVIYNFFIV